MHALPEKLNEHRQKIEASFKTQLLDQRAALEKKIEESAERASSQAVRDSETSWLPQFEALQQRMDKEIGHLSAMLSDAKGSASKQDNNKKSIESTFLGQLQELRLDLSHLKVDIPRLRQSVEEATKTVRPLQDSVQELREGQTSLQAELHTASEKLESKIADEVRRAEATESTWGLRLQDVASNAADERRNSEEKARRQAAEAMQHAASVEDRLRICIDQLSNDLTTRSQQHAQEAIRALRPEVDAAVEAVHHHVEERHGHVQAENIEMNRQLRAEIQVCKEDAVIRAMDGTSKRIAELTLDWSSKLEEADRRSGATQQGHAESLATTTSGLHSRMDEVSETLGGRMKQLEEALEAAQVAARDAMLWAEQSAMRTAERHASFDDALALVREAFNQESAGRQKDLDTVRKEARESVQQAEEALDRRIKDMGSRCTSISEASLEELSKGLRQELLSWKQTADDRADTVQREVRSTLTQEAAARKDELAQVDEFARRHTQSATLELQASLASLKADLSTRMDGLKGHVDANAERAFQLERSVEAQALTQAEDVKRLRDDADASVKKLEERISETATSLSTPWQRKWDSLEGRFVELQQSISSIADEKTTEVARLDALLKEKVARDELQEGVKAAMHKAAEVTVQISALEMAMQRQQGGFEAEARDLAAQCHAAQAEATEAKSRMQRETSALGSELSQVRAAATSLTHGVVKALQVLGLLREEVEVTDPKGQDGKALLVHRRWGIDVGDLLEWEKSGQPLASRVAQQWHPFERAEVPTVLALIERKANEADLRMLRAAIGGTLGSPVKLASLGGPAWTQPSVPWTVTGGGDGATHAEQPKAFPAETLANGEVDLGHSSAVEGSGPQRPLVPRRSAPAPRTAR
mmetsp:Transcript_46882/g.111602  ORF Transcript_46882/g.111602 Transcript_46882/m.111602 type:complete len:879 (-) Transcript_46882:111-2747(-)